MNEQKRYIRITLLAKMWGIDKRTIKRRYAPYIIKLNKRNSPLLIDMVAALGTIARENENL